MTRTFTSTTTTSPAVKQPRAKSFNALGHTLSTTPVLRLWIDIFLHGTAPRLPTVSLLTMIAERGLVTPRKWNSSGHGYFKENPNLRTHHMVNKNAERPAKKRRTDSSSSSSPKDAMNHLSDLALATPPTTPSTTPPATPVPVWKDVLIDAHISRSRAFTRTHVFARRKTANVYAISSRGFARELPPTRQTRPALRQRRHSVDVLTVGPFEGESVTLPYVPVDFEPLCVFSRETDEPIRREPVALFPDARRYRDLDREESHYYPSIDDPHGEDTYLELPRSSLSNSEFRTIHILDYPDCWFADNILDVALEMVSLEYDAESYGIYIANSLTGQCLFYPGAEGDIDGDNFAGMDEYKKMFGNKKWIFIPINDGMVEKDTAAAQGAHWSFIAVDRRNQMAHYVDSLFSRDWRYQRLAKTIATGLGNILGEEYNFRVEMHAPNQWQHNKYDNSQGWDAGPCGPFVITMIEEYVKEIVQRRDMGIGEIKSLVIGPGFAQIFQENFNSLEVRFRLTKRMARLKVKLDADRFANQHDALVLAGLEDTVEIIDDQQPLFDRRVATAAEEQFESDAESAVSPIREDDFDSDDLENEWEDPVKQEPTTCAEYDFLEADALRKAYELVRGGIVPHEEYRLEQGGVVHRSGFNRRLRRTSGIQLNRDSMVINDDEPAVDIKLSPTQVIRRGSENYDES